MTPSSPNPSNISLVAALALFIIFVFAFILLGYSAIVGIIFGIISAGSLYQILDWWDSPEPRQSPLPLKPGVKKKRKIDLKRYKSYPTPLHWLVDQINHAISSQSVPKK